MHLSQSCVVKHRPFLDLLNISHPAQRQAVLNSVSSEQVLCLCNCLVNIPYKADKLDIQAPKGKKQILGQHGGGFLVVALGPILHALTELT